MTHNLRLLDNDFQEGINIICFWFNTDKKAVYDLSQLKTSVNSRKFAYDGSKTEQQNITGTTSDIVYFRMCEDVSEKDCEIDDKKVSGQIFKLNKENECTLYAGDIGKGNKWSLLDEKDMNKGVRINFTSGGDFDGSKKEKYQVIFELYCNKNVSDLTIKDSKFDVNKQINIIKFESEHACVQLDLYQIWNFICSKKYIFASIMIALGLFEMLFGNYLIKPTTYIICMTAVVVFVFIFLFQLIIPSGASDAVLWVVLVIGCVIGAIVAFFISKYNKLIFGVVLGALSGYFLGQMLYISFFSSIKTNPTLIKILTYAATIIVLILFAYLFINVIIIFSTSFIGAYAFVRGISFFAGGFPSEATVIDYIERKEYEALKELLTWKVYVYLSAIVVCFIIGLIVQFKLNAEKKRQEEQSARDKFLDTNN
jgi:hypothetical protein